MRGKTIILNPTGNALSSNGTTVTTTQPVLFPDGTQAAPSISFSSDSDTGFFWASTGDFRYTSNGTQQASFRTNSFEPIADGTFALGSSVTRCLTLHAKSVTIGQSLTNPNMGEVTLSGASATAIAYTAAITAGSRIFLSKVVGRGTQGHIYVTSSTNGASFTVQSTSTTDTSVVTWWIVPVT